MAKKDLFLFLQILRNEKKHDRVVNLVTHNVAVSVNTFPDGVDFLSNTLAGLILNCNDDLKTCETQCFNPSLLMSLTAAVAIPFPV